MSEKDAGLLGNVPKIVVIENGVDLDRFRPEPEQPGQRLLFIGSFRHFPNIEAYRFFTEVVWPGLRARFPEMTLTVVAGPDHLIYWREFTGQSRMPPVDGIRLLGFVAEVRPLYVEANLVIVPTIVSAGTNVKVLEAMAMERAVVSTTCGCAGIGLAHAKSVWIADTSEDFREAVQYLAEHPEERRRLAAAARRLAERSFDWRVLGEKQAKMYRSLRFRQ
jgi:glycosyltransferase involved in cell wall biosynthesis